MLFCYNPHANLHNFLICTLSFLVSALWLAYLHFFKIFFLHGNVTFYLRLFHLCPPFQYCNLGIKQGLAIVNSYQTQTFTTMFLVYILENITIMKCEHL